jgi:hypothetical protein
VVVVLALLALFFLGRSAFAAPESAAPAPVSSASDVSPSASDVTSGPASGWPVRVL